METSLQTNVLLGIGEHRTESCFQVVLFAGLLDEGQHLESTATTYFDTSFIIVLVISYVPCIV